jgi:hypothetical protein
MAAALLFHVQRAGRGRCAARHHQARARRARLQLGVRYRARRRHGRGHGPGGVFTPRTLDGDFLLLAGGSGITPVFSILRSALRSGQRAHHALVRQPRRALGDLPPRAQRAGRLRTRRGLLVIHWLDSVQGVPSVAQLAELARPSRHGPGLHLRPRPVHGRRVAALQAIEMPPEQHPRRALRLAARREDDAAANAMRHRRAGCRDGRRRSAEVETAAWTARLLPPALRWHETLLEAALRAGIDAPYSCQAGMCALLHVPGQSRAACTCATTKRWTRRTWPRPGPWPARPCPPASGCASSSRSECMKSCFMAFPPTNAVTACRTPDARAHDCAPACR